MEYLIFSTFSIQRFKNAYSYFDFAPKFCYIGFMDIKIISIYNFLYYGRTSIHVFLFGAGAL